MSVMGYELSLNQEEEELLNKLETMCLEGKLHSVSMEGLQRRKKLNR